MRSFPASLALIAVVTFSLTLPNAAHAKGGGVYGLPGGGGGFGGGCGYGGDGGVFGGYGLAYGLGIGALYNTLQRPLDYRVPYFAVHPPVYYSYPVPRTYGHSPFAYPPHFRTPEFFEAVTPVTITNPHVPANDAPATESKGDDATVSVPAKSGPLMVINPYVVEPSLASSDR